MEQYGGTCAAAGIATNSVAVDMQNQMNAILKYNNTQGSSNVAELNAQPDPVTAADFYSEVFERPVVKDSDVRASVAQSVYAFLTGTPTPPSPSPVPGQPYTIQSGDTLNSIATAAYGPANADAGVTAIENANPGINPDDLQIGQEINIPVLGRTGGPVPGQPYTIQSGDTLNSIATAAYGPANADAGVTAIENANPGINPDDLQIGQEINIPVLGRTGGPVPGQPYTIQSGDTLNSIATAAYGPANADAGVTAIENANPGINPDDLQIGQEINIPVLGGTGDQFQAAILAAHNSYRAAVATEEPLQPLQWSGSLAASAQNWANHLATIGTLQEPGVGGVNLADATAGTLSVTQLVGLWGNEQQFFIDGVFPDISTTGNWEAAGHYSQMVWRNTTEVGGGLATGQGQDFLVCYYNPAGNVTGETAY